MSWLDSILRKFGVTRRAARWPVLAIAGFGLITCAPQADPDRTRTALHTLFDEVFGERLKRSPMLQTSLGMGEDHDRWDDFGDGAAEYSVAIAREHLARLETEIDPALLDEEDRLSYRLLERELKLEIEGERWIYHTYPLNQLEGLQSELPAFLINTHTVDSVEDARSYIARLRGLEWVIDQVIEGLRTRTEKGIVPPRFAFPQVYRDIDNLLEGEPFVDGEANPSAESPLWADIREKVQALGLPEAETSSLLEEAKEALLEHVEPSFRRLRTAAEKQEAAATDDDGVWKLPDGDEFYHYSLRLHTTTALDPETIHQMGLAEVDRIHDDLAALMERVEFEGTLQDFFDFMGKSPQFRLPETDEGRAEYLRLTQVAIDRIEERVDEFFLTQPKAELVLKRVEPFREASAGIAFYQEAALDGSRPGIYYTNLHRMSERPTYNIETIAYHEATPGHHMQVSIAQELEGLPMFRRLAGYTAFDEGWGLYAEQLGKEMGGFEDPYSDFGRLAEELWRACRLVVDTGVHAKRWTRQQMIDYHLENTPNPLGMIVKEVERYIVLPGQATSYKVGMAKVLELRAAARRELGDRFDIREFHDVVLTGGSLPLDVVEANVQRWVEAKKSGRHP